LYTIYRNGAIVLKLPEQNPMLLTIKILGVVVISVAIYFIVHEFSHLATMLLCNGTFQDMHFGVTSFVSGYVDQQHVWIIAISSLIIPLLLSTILFFIKNIYVKFFVLGFTWPSLINSALGLFAIWFIKDSTRNTYDVALAYDSTKMPIVIVVTALIGALYSAMLVCISFVQIVKEA
jgi:hypothetical protein